MVASLLLRDAANACWEAIRPAVIDFPHAWAACTRDDVTGAVGRHGHRQNARYVLVKSTGFFNSFFFWFWLAGLIAGFLLNHQVSITKQSSISVPEQLMMVFFLFLQVSITNCSEPARQSNDPQSIYFRYLYHKAFRGDTIQTSLYGGCMIN